MAFSSSQSVEGAKRVPLADLVAIFRGFCLFQWRWGWRIPFIASVILIGISMYIQLNLEDTQSFKELQSLKDEQLKEDKSAPK
jgi:hypothetical protein